MAKRALITGVTGQDGAYLARLLLDKGYEVCGTYAASFKDDFWRLQYLDIQDKIILLPLDLSDFGSISDAIQRSKPSELYHLAALSFAGGAFDDPIAYGDIDGLAVTRLLEAVRRINPNIKLFQASTMALFGDGDGKPLTESGPLKPTNPYGVAKLYAYWSVRIYREHYGAYACNGIMFNHESPLRGLEFVTRKITNAVAKIALGLENELTLGDLNARRDWGYAPEYVKAMWLMLQQDEPDDYIIATNDAHSVGEFAQKAFQVVGLDLREYVRTDGKLLRSSEAGCCQGDYSKSRDRLDWQPETGFEQLVETMTQDPLGRWRRWMRGERFPWDVPNCPDEKPAFSRASGALEKRRNCGSA
ncbi:MAG: GDP-mannose 4,6-dehydratase [Chloroflexi bacterium]|nr:GDP-mannose 4,6-dehydratase [Chloroflexota bacterium]